LLAQTQNQVGGTHALFACGILNQQSIGYTKPESGWGNSHPIRRRHLGSAIYCLHKTSIRLRELTSYSHAACQISNPLLAQSHNQVGGTHVLFACGILNQQSIACTKPESGWGNSRPIRMRHVESAIYCLHKTTIRLGELTSYSHAASQISNLLLAQNQNLAQNHDAQNQNRVGGTHCLFACGILDQQSIACTKPQSGWGNSLPIHMRHLGSAIYCLHKTRIRLRLRELTSYSHAAPRISNMSAQNQHQVEGTHALFACGILDQQSIACTKPASG